MDAGFAADDPRREEGAMTFITGQQIGLLGGPLYTTYKVLGAAKLAAEKNAKAVYWLETNDADFEEISKLSFIDASGKIERLVWEKKTGGETSGSILVDEGLRLLLEKYFSALPKTEDTAQLRESAMGAYQKNRSLGEASEILARSLYGFLNIEFFRPDHPSFRDFSKPFLLKEAMRTAEGAQANGFILDTRSGRSIRRAFFKKNGVFQTREGEKIDPEKFILLPNVRTRNIVQDAFFASREHGDKQLVYVAGPGEIAYLKDMGEAYAFHGVTPALVIPRMSATLLEPKIRRLVEKSGIPIETWLSEKSESLLKKTVTLASGEDLAAKVARAEAAFRSFVNEVKGLDFDAARIEKDIYETLKHVVGKKRREIKAKSEKELVRTHAILDHLRPAGEKQERVFNAFQYMNGRGGAAFIRTIYERYASGEQIFEI